MRGERTDENDDTHLAAGHDPGDEAPTPAPRSLEHLGVDGTRIHVGRVAIR